MKLSKLDIDQETKKSLPLFYHFIQYNRLEPGNPLTYTEFCDRTQSLVFFQRPDKLISKVLDMTISDINEAAE